MCLCLFLHFFNDFLCLFLLFAFLGGGSLVFLFFGSCFFFCRFALRVGSWREISIEVHQVIKSSFGNIRPPDWLDFWELARQNSWTRFQESANHIQSTPPLGHECLDPLLQNTDLLDAFVFQGPQSSGSQTAQQETSSFSSGQS